MRRVVANLVDDALEYAGAAEVDVAGDADEIRIASAIAGPAFGPTS